MHKLRDQWIEIIDGHEHMVKAVEPFELCQGCLFNCNQGGCCWKGFDSCHMGSYFIIKDLGILNEDGLLRVPFDVPNGYPLYPTIASYSTSLGEKDSLFQVIYSNIGLHIAYGVFNSEQEAKDAWNRRS